MNALSRNMLGFLFLYALVVEPVLAFIILAGGAFGGIVFWLVAVKPCSDSLKPKR